MEVDREARSRHDDEALLVEVHHLADVEHPSGHVEHAGELSHLHARNAGAALSGSSAPLKGANSRLSQIIPSEPRNASRKKTTNKRVKLTNMPFCFCAPEPVVPFPCFCFLFFFGALFMAFGGIK